MTTANDWSLSFGGEAIGLKAVSLPNIKTDVDECDRWLDKVGEGGSVTFTGTFDPHDSMSETLDELLDEAARAIAELITEKLIDKCGGRLEWAVSHLWNMAEMERLGVGRIH